MMNSPAPEVPKWALALLNNLYEVEQKIRIHGDTANVARNISKMKDVLEELGVFYEDPMGQAFKETRTDLEATIAGNGTEDLEVVEVIKPIIRSGTRTLSRISQKGIVVVEAKPKEKAS